MPQLALVGDGPVQSEADRIYAAYPRKVGKADALRSIDKVIRSLRHDSIRRGLQPNAVGEWLLARVLAYAGSPKVRGSDPRFIPHPATWFNRGSYDDEPTEWGLPKVRAMNVAAVNAPSPWRSPPVFGSHNPDDWRDFVCAVDRGEVGNGPVPQALVYYAVMALRQTGEVPAWADCVEATRPCASSTGSSAAPRTRRVFGTADATVRGSEQAKGARSVGAGGNPIASSGSDLKTSDAGKGGPDPDEFDRFIGRTPAPKPAPPPKKPALTLDRWLAGG